MQITIKDCLNLKSFTRCDILSGSTNTNNMVSGVNVVDGDGFEQIAQQVKKDGQFVLTSFAGIKKSEDKAAIVRKLASLKSSGIGIVNGINSSKDYTEIVRAGEEVELPIILFAPGTNSYGDIIEDISNRLNFEGSFGNKMIASSLSYLMDFSKGGGFEDAVKRAAIANDFQLILFDQEYRAVFMLETKKGVGLDEIVKAVKASDIQIDTDIYRVLNIKGLLTYWGLKKIDNTTYYMVIIDNNDNYDSESISKLAEIIEVAISMWKFTVQKEPKIEMLKLLLSGDKIMAEQFANEAGIDPDSIISVYYSRNISTKKDTKTRSEILKEDKGIEIIVYYDDHDTYGLIIDNKPKLFSEKKRGPINRLACQKYYESLMQKNETNKIFHVTGFMDIGRAIENFDIIEKTWKSALAIFQAKSIMGKSELMLTLTCREIIKSQPIIKNNYLSILKPLEYELTTLKKSQLIDTLEIFVLDGGLNMTVTAKLMNLHINTIQYRVGHLNEILGVDLNSDRTQPSLMMAIALQRLERKDNAFNI